MRGINRKTTETQTQSNFVLSHFRTVPFLWASRFRQFYFHVNGSIGIVQTIESEIRPDLGQPSKRREKCFWTTRLCVFVCLGVAFVKVLYLRNRIIERRRRLSISKATPPETAIQQKTERARRPATLHSWGTAESRKCLVRCYANEARLLLN